jgi:hypothetical protein
LKNYHTAEQTRIRRQEQEAGRQKTEDRRQEQEAEEIKD